ncbi:hypothetical protein LPJ59_001171 [Coemansia sp. RSA 2399]|nr:hypothetical protein LPJ59_001171 [Coemansia sp. RSA 2399]
MGFSLQLSLELVAPADCSIKFQRDNANWSAVPSASRESYVNIVNSVDDSSKEGGRPDEVTMECNSGIQKEFCEVFNQMDGIRKLDLAPHETVELVLLCVSNEPKNSSQTPAHSRRPSLGLVAAHSASVNGVAHGNGSSDAAASSDLAGIDAKSSEKAHCQYKSTFNSIALQAMADDRRTAVDSYSICLRTSFCKSVLEVDPPTSRVYIDDCVVGKLYERVITIKNASEIGLDWSMTVVETTDTTSLSSLQLLDNNMEPLNDGHLSASQSSQMLIKYTPQSVGEFLCRFLIENKNDPSNQRYWVFRARVSQREKPKLVELLSDPDINFGDCTSGVWNYREITLRNVSETPVAMRFRVEGNTSNLTMKSSVKEKQDQLEDGTTADDQQPTEAPLQRNEHGHPAETPASSRSDAGLGDDNLSESVNANDAQDEATSEGGGIQDSVRSQDIGTGDTSSLADKPDMSRLYSQGDFLDDGSTQSDIFGPSDLLSASTGKATSISVRRESSGPFQDVLDLDRRMHPRSRLTASYAHQPAQFDEVLIKPGSVRTVVLSLIGKPVNSASVNAGQFDRQTFTFFCEYTVSTSSKQPSRFPKSTPSSEKNEDRLSLPCTVNMCTPFVRVSPPMLDFGSVDVGMLKTMYLQIDNLSQVDATVQCKLESKVINCIRAPIVIPPLQSKSVRVDIYPRRVNARYRKQIIVRNKHNRLNDIVVEVRSVHVDQRRMAFHNLFYKTLVPQNEQNFVDFGTVPFNSRVMRRINLQNLCCCPVTIGLSTGDGAGAGTPFPLSVDCDLESNEAFDNDNNSRSSSSRCSSNGSNDSNDDNMITTYTVVPLIADGAVTQAARDVAKQLPLLERQAVMHSTIEAFKEHSGGFRVPKDMPAHSNTNHMSTQPRAYSAKMHKDGGVRRILQPGIFVDKAVERGHVCLVPFSKPGKPDTTVPLSIDYLDVPLAFTRKQPSVRIREHGNGELPLDDPGGGGEAVTSLKLQKSPASSLDKKSAEDLATTAIIGRAMQILDQIISNLDTVPKTLFASSKAEDEYVRKQVDLHKYVDLLVESGFLQPISQIVLPPSGTELVIVMLRPSGEQAALDKPTPPRFDANLYFRLIDRPSDLLPYTDSTSAAVFANSYQLPVRRFLIQASLCRMELEVGQKSINVGSMQVDEASRKYLVIKNRTETPLMYAIRKTGSIASGDIQFVDNNRYGVVRGFDSRKVVFVFSPSLNGVYNEQMNIANVLNAHGGKTAILKAVVRRPSKFYIQSLLLEFGNKVEEDRGPLPGDEQSDGGGVLSVGVASSDVQILTIKNMTPKTRHLAVIAADVLAKEGVQLLAPQQSQDQQQQQQQQAHHGALSPGASVVLDPLFPVNVATLAVAPKRHYDRETEEKIETLEQKMKIAVRKKQPEKTEKYRQKLAKLRGTDGATDRADPAAGAAKPEDAAVIRRLENDTQVAVTLPPLCAVDIPLVVVPRIAEQARRAGRWANDSNSSFVVEEAVGHLVVHEEKDKDNVKLVTLKALVRVGFSPPP